VSLPFSIPSVCAVRMTTCCDMSGAVLTVFPRHSFHPSPTATVDTRIYLWAHPMAVQDPMDRLFFQTLLRHLSDAYDSKTSPSILQIMVTQYVLPHRSLLVCPLAVQFLDRGADANGKADKPALQPWLCSLLRHGSVRSGGTSRINCSVVLPP
jgi:hypothetical protein